MKVVIILFFLLISGCSLFAQDKVPGFPGAEGFGKYTTGGRGGKVLFVTNLNDDNNIGSLRYALNQTGPRIILFKVSGTIRLKSKLAITKGDVTIAGQSAPADGICLRDYSVEIQADNVVIRFIRFRMGDEAQQQDDAFWGRNHSNILIDHCSMSWSTDECASFYDNTNFTMQWCILSESLRNSVHNKGAHGYGGIWGGKSASFHHNLLAHHDSRNPRFCGTRYSNRKDLELVDFRNNVIYNWGSNSSYGAEGGSYNLVNNYYKPGPATSSSSKARIMQPYPDDGSNNQPAGTFGKFYVSGNVIPGNSAVSADNWLGVLQHSSFTSYTPLVTAKDMKTEVEYPTSNVTTHTAINAFQKVLDFAGASLSRDAVDNRIVGEVNAGNATFLSGGNGSSNGILDTQSAAGGWPDLKSAPAPADSDQDGIPDVWEESNGLQKNNPADNLLTTLDGKYTNLEVYINSLVASITEKELKDGIITSISAERNESGPLKIFMDNSSGLLQIVHQQIVTLVKVYSLSGIQIKQQSLHENRPQISLSDLFPGVYVVSVRDMNQVVYTRKIVVNSVYK